MRKVTQTILGDIIAQEGDIKHHITCPYSRFCHATCALYNVQKQTSDDCQLTVTLAMCGKHTIGELVPNA